jgi:hypothetical protein
VAIRLDANTKLFLLRNYQVENKPAISSGVCQLMRPYEPVESTDLVP